MLRLLHIVLHLVLHVLAARTNIGDSELGRAHRVRNRQPRLHGAEYGHQEARPIHQGWVGDLFRHLHSPESFSVNSTEPPNWFPGHEAVIYAWPQTDEAATPWPGEIRAAYRLAGLLPYGRQDMGAGLLYDQLVITGGFCSGFEFGSCAVRGFINETWAMPVGESLKDRPKRWTSLAPFPGDARQSTACFVARDYAAADGNAVNDADEERLHRLFCWGGFNYSPLPADAVPEAFKQRKTDARSFAEGYSLGPDRVEDALHPERWSWRQEKDMPYRSGTSSIAYDSENELVYLFGGCSYDGQYYCDTDDVGGHDNLGSQLHVLNLRDGHAEWKLMPACPGTPRAFPAFSFANGNQLFVIGGFTTLAGKNISTVIDNWRFDVATETWHPLPDCPFTSASGYQRPTPLWRDRYMVLLGGAYRGSVSCGPDEQRTYRLGDSTRLQQMPDNAEAPASAAVYYFDTQTEQFGSLDPLPLANNGPITVMKDDILYLLGGEAPALFGKSNTHVNMMLAMLLTDPATKATLDTADYMASPCTRPFPTCGSSATLTDAVNPYTGEIGLPGSLERYYIEGGVFRVCTASSIAASVAGCVGPLVPVCSVA